MSSVNTYLTFSGNCREAFEFYQKVFGTTFESSGTFKDMPPEYTVDEKYQDYIMHASMKFGETVLMASDTTPDFGPPLVQGNNFSLSYAADSEEEARRIFDELASEGAVGMPLAPAFWGSLFGSLKDKFGINWMISYEYPKAVEE